VGLIPEVGPCKSNSDGWDIISPVLKETTRTDNSQIARAAGTVMAAFILANLVGLIRGIVITNAFGTNADLDAFYAANRVTELLFNLVAGGALASAFIPTFTGFLVKKDREGAWRLASAVTNLVLLVLIGVGCLAFIFAPQLVKHGLYLLAPGTVVDQQELTSDLLRIMLPSVIIFGVSGLMMGILNSHRVFLIPAIAPAMNSIGMIAGTLLLAPRMGISGLAWGAVLGAVGHLLIQIPRLLKLKGRRYLPVLDLRDTAVREVVRLMGPRVLGVAVVQLNFFVNTIIALGLSEGSVSALVWAFGLMMIPQMAIAQSTAIAALPTFSTQAAEGRLAELRNSVSSSLRVIILLSMPAAVGLILLSQPLVAMLYQRGEFNEYSTSLVAWALAWYAAGLVGHSILEVVSRAFYALHDTRTPVMVGVIAMGLNIGFSFSLAALFKGIGWMPHGGLALANSLATALEVVALLLLLNRRMGSGNIKSLSSAFRQSTIGVLVMGLSIWALLRYYPSGNTIILTLGGVFVGTVVYGLVLLGQKTPEVGQVVRAVEHRLRHSS
jgi:putative peptidoglycan lipid II flippase